MPSTAWSNESRQGRQNLYSVQLNLQVIYYRYLALGESLKLTFNLLGVDLKKLYNRKYFNPVLGNLYSQFILHPSSMC